MFIIFKETCKSRYYRQKAYIQICKQNCSIQNILLPGVGVYSSVVNCFLGCTSSRFCAQLHKSALGDGGQRIRSLGSSQVHSKLGNLGYMKPCLSTVNYCCCLYNKRENINFVFFLAFASCFQRFIPVSIRCSEEMQC